MLVKKKRLLLEHIPGLQNPSDGLTKSFKTRDMLIKFEKEREDSCQDLTPTACSVLVRFLGCVWFVCVFVIAFCWLFCVGCVAFGDSSMDYVLILVQFCFWCTLSHENVAIASIR